MHTQGTPQTPQTTQAAHKKQLLKFRKEYTQMLANTGIAYELEFPHIDRPQPMTLEYQMMHIASSSHMNILWARMTYIFDDLALACPTITNTQGLRHIVMRYMEQPYTLLGDMLDTPETVVLVTRDMISHYERRYPMIYY
jgi:hypothetical protein